MGVPGAWRAGRRVSDCMACLSGLELPGRRQHRGSDRVWCAEIHIHAVPPAPPGQREVPRGRSHHLDVVGGRDRRGNTAWVPWSGMTHKGQDSVCSMVCRWWLGDVAWCLWGRRLGAVRQGEAELMAGSPWGNKGGCPH